MNEPKRNKTTLSRSNLSVGALIVFIKETPALRYLSAGTLTFLCEYIVFYILYVFVDLHLVLANSLSFGAGLSVSFMLNRHWTFKEGSYQRKAHHQAVIYSFLALFNLLINNLVVALLKSAGLDPRIGKILAIAVIAVWNFIVYRKIIFKTKTEDK